MSLFLVLIKKATKNAIDEIEVDVLPFHFVTPHQFNILILNMISQFEEEKKTML